MSLHLPTRVPMYLRMGIAPPVRLHSNTYFDVACLQSRDFSNLFFFRAKKTSKELCICMQVVVGNFFLTKWELATMEKRLGSLFPSRHIRYQRRKNANWSFLKLQNGCKIRIRNGICSDGIMYYYFSIINQGIDDEAFAHAISLHLSLCLRLFIHITHSIILFICTPSAYNPTSYTN